MRRVLPLLLLLAACTTAGPGADGPGPGDVTTLSKVVFEVDFQPDAEPYTGPITPGGADTWDLFHTNVAALYEGTGVTFEAPRDTADMGTLPASDDEAYNYGEILDLSDAHLDTAPADGLSVIHVLFLDGNYEDDDGVQEGVIGVSLGRTGVIAMFKPVVERLGLTPVGRTFGEQVTLIHEFGHALGLVANGIAPVADHHDEENGAHCTNDACVMYWANEGPSELVQFIQRYVATGDTVVFGTDCLDDVEAHFDR